MQQVQELISFSGNVFMSTPTRADFGAFIGEVGLYTAVAMDPGCDWLRRAAAQNDCPVSAEFAVEPPQESL